MLGEGCDLNETSMDSRGTELDVLGATSGEFGNHQVVRLKAESWHPAGGRLKASV